MTPRFPLPVDAFGTAVMRDGWPVRTFVLEPAGERRGVLLFAGGRGDFIEKYAETLIDWAAAGWQVCTFDWRGQGGSGRLGRDGGTGHADDFAPWVADIGELAQRWTVADEPFAVVGHSMGGHLVLRALVERVVAADAVVLVAPMIGTRGPPAGVGRWVAGTLALTRGADRAAWAENEAPGRVAGGRQALLTHDNARYADEMDWRGRSPELILGPPSWGWLAAAYRSALATFTKPRLAEVRTPLLMLNALADRLVDPEAAARAAARLPNATLVEFGDSVRHEILREADPARDHALARIAEFLDQHAAR